MLALAFGRVKGLFGVVWLRIGGRCWLVLVGVDIIMIMTDFVVLCISGTVVVIPASGHLSPGPLSGEMSPVFMPRGTGASHGDNRQT